MTLTCQPLDHISTNMVALISRKQWPCKRGLILFTHLVVEFLGKPTKMQDDKQMGSLFWRGIAIPFAAPNYLHILPIFLTTVKTKIIGAAKYSKEVQFMSVDWWLKVKSKMIWFNKIIFLYACFCRADRQKSLQFTISFIFRIIDPRHHRKVSKCFWVLIRKFETNLHLLLLFLWKDFINNPPPCKICIWTLRSSKKIINIILSYST